MTGVMALFPPTPAGRLLATTAVAALAGGAMALGYRPAREFIARQEHLFDRVVRKALLIDIRPRVVTIFCAVWVFLFAILGWFLTSSLVGFFLCFAVALFLPGVVLRILRRRRREKLEDQLVGGIQNISAGVRAGLNLVQAMGLIARDGPSPIRQEFRHLLREYEYGVPLDEAMRNAADRIGSGDFRLLFSALETHRERGGDLGETLDRIADSIREIQRLEKRVQTLTAQGRATSRWLGAMPLAVLGILYMIESSFVVTLLTDSIGKIIIAIVVTLNIVGFFWIRKIVSIDI